MRKTIFLLPLSLLLLLSGCANPNTIRLSAAAIPPEDFSSRQCDLTYMRDEYSIDEKSILGKLIYAGVVSRLNNHGIQVVEQSDSCHIYAIWGERPETSSYNQPVYGQTGIHQINRYSRRTGRVYTRYEPSYGITGYQRVESWYNLKYITMIAYDADDEQIFTVAVAKNGAGTLRETAQELLCGVNYALLNNYDGTELAIPDLRNDPEQYARICGTE